MPRIIAGRLKGRRLAAPRGLQVRPTGDMARESLFAVLGPAVRKGPFLDLFAGTGAVGLEAYSRGAPIVVMVEADPRFSRLRHNLDLLGLGDEIRVISGDWRRALSRLDREGLSFAVIFADPPYDTPLADECLRSSLTDAILQPDGLLIIEHRRKVHPVSPPTLFFRRRLAAGEAAFSFFSKEEIT